MNSIPSATVLRPAGSGQGRHVLIADFDLFRNLGGGQAVYQRLVVQRPQDRFYYFALRETAEAPRPANAVAIPFVAEYAAVPLTLPRSLHHLLWIYRDARNLAYSARLQLGQVAFDVVDVPDYTQNGVFLRAALEAEGLACGTLALALHGTLSAAFANGWPGGGDAEDRLNELRSIERLQFAAADARYAISASYAAECQANAPLPVNLVDPLVVLDRIEPAPAPLRPGPPDLAFVGRREKCKGPDLFLDLAWCIEPGQYRRLLMVGPDGLNMAGAGSFPFLSGIARLRNLNPEIPGGIPRSEVLRLMAERTVLLLPSRLDTFNLVALEALAAGCPALISRHAGIAAWLGTHLPQLDWLLLDLDCSRTAAGRAAEVLQNYDARRAELVAAIRSLPRPAADAFAEIYRPAAERDIVARQEAAELAARFATLLPLRRRAGWVKALAWATVRLVPGPVRAAAGRVLRPVRNLLSPLRWLRQMRRGGSHWAAKEAMKGAIRRATGLSARTVMQVESNRRWGAMRFRMLDLPEATTAETRAKLGYLAGRVSDSLVNRVPLFQEMARLERRLGNDLVAGTYALRVMRWLGRDSFGELPFVGATLRAHGFAHEADVAEAMFGPEHQREGRCYELLQDARRRNMAKEDLPLAVHEDLRGDAPRRVAVIVSLYNAADKLPTLLACLAQQTLAQRGELEVVLVDSNSPSDERRALQGFLARQALPVLYARSAGRETIQNAWNRGIRLARAPYLAFLGADEGLHPDALRQLAAALDADPRADWAMADSVVTDVDAAGTYVGDVMPYDRTGYRQDLVYLDTCYLSWVGGLYRASIHDRCGYYDESFRAAGDTEFKSRIMPFIRSVHVPRMLGVFNNYPEERTTAHPRAEIEDLRAWYLPRSQAGMRYAFENRPVEEAMALLRTALNYRKSFCGHLSSDFDLADALARYLETRPDVPAEWAARARAATGKAMALMQRLEHLPGTVSLGRRGLPLAAHVLGQVRAARGGMAARHQQVFNLRDRPHYEVFNDNRYEQHWWSWSR